MLTEPEDKQWPPRAERRGGRAVLMGVLSAVATVLALPFLFPHLGNLASGGFEAGVQGIGVGLLVAALACADTARRLWTGRAVPRLYRVFIAVPLVIAALVVGALCVVIAHG